MHLPKTISGAVGSMTYHYQRYLLLPDKTFYTREHWKVLWEWLSALVKGVLHPYEPPCEKVRSEQLFQTKSLVSAVTSLQQWPPRKDCLRTGQAQVVRVLSQPSTLCTWGMAKQARGAFSSMNLPVFPLILCSFLNVLCQGQCSVRNHPFFYFELAICQLHWVLHSARLISNMKHWKIQPFYDIMAVVNLDVD